MRRLLLLRHAKAEQDSGDGDFARALNARGRSDAARMGHAMDTRTYWPDLVLCSSARRTMETFEFLVPELAKAPRAEFAKALYLASPKAIFDMLRKAADETTTLLMIGHNPGIEDIGARLARKPQSPDEAARRESLREKYPTCGLTVLDFHVDQWRDIAPGAGALTDFLRPRDLRD